MFICDKCKLKFHGNHTNSCKVIINSEMEKYIESQFIILNQE